MAELIGMSVQMIQQVERGVTAPSFCTLEALSNALNVPLAMMFPVTVSAKRSMAKDKAVSAITANAVRLSREDA
ncbi:MAG: helix-turn-helix transcriptional regulator [Pseudomonadota bacterium]